MRMRTISSILIYLSIAGVLCGCLAGAIMRVRDAAAKADCMNNQKHIAIGWHMYCDTVEYLPCAAMESLTQPPEQRLSWLFELDPFIHARMDPDWKPHREQPWNSEANLRIAKMRMPWYLCRENSMKEIDGLQATHYVGVSGVGRDAAGLPTDSSQIGLFSYEPRAIPRGKTVASPQTLLVAETQWDNGPWVAGGRPTVRGLEQGHERPYVGNRGQFGGMHRGGTNMLFSDGTVRLIKDSIEPRLLKSMATISGSSKLDLGEVERVSVKP